jgi:hypothetical protein
MIESHARAAPCVAGDPAAMAVWTRNAALAAMLMVGLLAISCPARADDRSQEAGAERLPPEVPDDPPGKPARAVPGAKAATTITFGRFTSVQVNVSPAGANIPGDAANEPTIAVDPTNHSRMVIGWRQFDTIASNFREAGYAYTTDSGTTWTKGEIESNTFRSDPVLDSNSSGGFFYNSLMGDFTSQVFPSGDGGATWGASVFAYGGDKQWMTIDKGTSTGSGFQYQAWSTAGNNYAPNTFNRSPDGGASFQAPWMIPIPPIWGTLAVSADGTLYVAGTSANVIYVARSTNAKNAGSTPTFTMTAVNLGGTIRLGGPNPGGLLGQVWIGVDRSNGPHAGWVYLLASVQSANDPVDVMFSRSTDGGQTWSSPLRVNDDPGSSHAWQWFGTMSVAPDGMLEAVWNDTRASSDSSMSALYYSYSLDGGVTWSANEQASPVWNSRIGWPNQQKIGDYYHMVSDVNGADLAWAATFNGEEDVFYVRIPRVGSAFVGDPGNGFGLHAAIPNPFATSTTIAFEMPPGGGHATLAVYDVTGRRVATLIDEGVSGGPHLARWSGIMSETGHDAPPGVYMCRLEGAGHVEKCRLVRLR